jgi:hypothetical protein
MFRGIKLRRDNTFLVESRFGGRTPNHFGQISLEERMVKFPRER